MNTFSKRLQIINNAITSSTNFSVTLIDSWNNEFCESLIEDTAFSIEKRGLDKIRVPYSEFDTLRDFIISNICAQIEEAHKAELDKITPTGEWSLNINC